MEIKIGMKLVYPGYGLVTVSNQVVGINGINQHFVVNSQQGMSIIIPYNKLKDFNLRLPVTKSEATKVFKKVMNSKQDTDNSTWNRRYRDLMEKIKSNDFTCLVEAYRDLISRKLCGDLSFGERKMLDTVSELLYAELSEVGQEELLNRKAM